MPSVNSQLSDLDAEPGFERAEQDAVLDEEQDPAIEPHVLRHEQRDGEQQGQQRRPAAEHPRQAIGDRIADQRQQNDRQRREAQRPQEGDVAGAVEDGLVVAQGRRLPQAEGARRHEAVADDGQQRRREADQQEQDDRHRIRGPGTQAPGRRLRRACRRGESGLGHQSPTRMLSRAFQPIITSLSSCLLSACWRSRSTMKTCSPTRT